MAAVERRARDAAPPLRRWRGEGGLGRMNRGRSR